MKCRYLIGVGHSRPLSFLILLFKAGFPLGGLERADIVLRTRVKVEVDSTFGGKNNSRLAQNRLVENRLKCLL